MTGSPVAMTRAAASATVGSRHPPDSAHSYVPFRADEHPRAFAAVRAPFDAHHRGHRRRLAGRARLADRVEEPFGLAPIHRTTMAQRGSAGNRERLRRERWRSVGGGRRTCLAIRAHRCRGATVIR